MNWVSELIDLYEKNTDQVGVVETYKNNTYTLLPLFHTTVTAHIVVVIDQKGDLIDAKLVELNDRQTIIPITNESNSRTGTTVAPHPLCDNLKYLAGDLSDYCNHDKKWNRAYLCQLEKWIDSDFTHEKVRSIYQYIKKETLIKDLVQRKIVQLDINGRIDVKQKIQGSELLKAFVRVVRQIKYCSISQIKTGFLKCPVMV